MKQVAVMAGSTATIPPEVAERYDITRIPFHIIMDGKDYLDIRMTEAEKEQLRHRMISRQNLPTTSPPSPGEMLEAFRQASQKGVKGIVYITMTSGFAMEYKSGLKAKEIAEEELPGVSVEVLDSQTVSAGEGLIAIEAVRAASQGNSLSEVVKVANKIKQKVTEFWVPDSLFYFDSAGRLGKAKPLVGSPVSVAAVLEVDIATGGVVNPASKQRTVAKAVENAVLIMKQRSGNKKLHVMVGHTFRPDFAEELKQRVLSLCQPVEFYLSENAPVTGVLNGAYVDLGFFIED